VTLTFDLLSLKVVSESTVAWATSVPILDFLGLSVLDLVPMSATDVRQTDVRQKHRLMPRLLGAGRNEHVTVTGASGSAAGDVLRHCDLNDLSRAVERASNRSQVL